MNFSRISRQIPENSDGCRFFNQMCENIFETIRNLPKILNFVKIIHYCSKLFTSLLGHLSEEGAGRNFEDPNHRRRLRPDNWSWGNPREGLDENIGYVPQFRFPCRRPACLPRDRQTSLWAVSFQNVHTYVFSDFCSNFWLIFGKLCEALSQLYRSQILRVNTR